MGILYTNVEDEYNIKKGISRWQVDSAIQRQIASKYHYLKSLECTSIKAVKYLFKYIYKGSFWYDMQSKNLIFNNLLRYVFERTIYKIYQLIILIHLINSYLKEHDSEMSHTIYRLPVHYVNYYKIVYKTGK